MIYESPDQTAPIRERIGEFFRRYPYDEWYALDEKEMTEYKKEYPNAEPFGWQRVPSKTTAG